MYRIIIVCATCLLVTRAAVIPNESEAKIISYENTNDGAGNYKFSFETSNGITRKESGYLVNVGQKDEHVVVEGSYSYTDVDGNVRTVKYTADENGYHIISDQPALVPQVVSALPASAVATLLGK